VERLQLLVEFATTNVTRGMHFCDLCPRLGRAILRLFRFPSTPVPCGHAEIRVVGGDGTIYAAPTLVHHYVRGHNYQPPQPFVEALLRRADLRWDIARERDLCLSCGSSMRRTSSNKGVRIVDGRREPMIVVSLACDVCGTTYSRG
jgi:hypothetical protein